MQMCKRRQPAFNKSRVLAARPQRSASKRRISKDKKPPRKPSATLLSDGRGQKTSKKTAGKEKKKSSAKKNVAIKAIMKQFKGARPSDVSDKLFVATSPVHGKGLFAARKIKADTVLGRLHGMPTFDDGIYVLWITDEIGLELTNDFKYINHNSKPNAAYSDIDVTALRDIEPGEELLHDYGW